MTERHEDLECIERNLGLLLRRSRRVIADAAREIDPELDVAAYGLLLRIQETESIKPSELAAYFGIGRPTVTRQLAELERLQLVTRQHDHTDARSFRVELTPEGGRRVSEVRKSRQQNFRNSLTKWSDKELHQLAQGMEKLNQIWE
jgi:DNA-binding MarR family transcriptional regulator